MKTKSLFLAIVPALLVAFAATAGCDDGTDTATDQQAADQQQTADPSSKQQYPIHGEVVAVDHEKPSVTLDHEEIEGLMKAMQMEFQVEDPQVLEQIEQGDQVQGQLVKKEGEFVITDLKERTE